MPPPPPPPPTPLPTSAPTPIIIGIADIKNRDTSVAAAREPAALMLEAIEAALVDAFRSESSSELAKVKEGQEKGKDKEEGVEGTKQKIDTLRAAIDSIDVVRTWTWPYADLPGLLAERLGVRRGGSYDEDSTGTNTGKKSTQTGMPKEKGRGIKWLRYSEHGGDKPAKLVDEAARRIARGEVEVCVVTGGEALASLSACAAAKKLPPPGWSVPAQAVERVFSPTGRDLGDNLGAVHQIGAPIHVYPLYENAFRAHRGQSLDENHRESARLYAEFSRIAAEHEYAWGHGRQDDEETIARVGGRNRMICYPYPLLMNAFNTVNLSSALILTSTRVASALSIPRSNWIYPLAGAGTSDASEFWLRPTYHSSPSLSASLTAALTRAGTTPAELALLDIYSCFPIVPKLAAAHLRIPLSGPRARPLSLLGGLTSFGGAGNNYSMHALTEMTRQLRKGKGGTGLVLANGGVLSYMHAVVLSSSPRKQGAYPVDEGLPAVLDAAAPRVTTQPRGEAVVETYTVEFARDGSPLRGFIVGRLVDSGDRFLANHGDEATLAVMAAGRGEVVGRRGWVRCEGGRGLFVFERAAL